ncbi:MalY/PatB family protein [uncultured Bacteroides sp.]|uniref:MalY/PatB family protein n=1 Tax=uncultured Bacteroides sp. TaxID=162156 RepID=UPI002613C81D|nr:PatB family C-S lyase [uncultured Bacteroides sp.]
MESYNFDKLIDRTGTDAYKYENLKSVFGRTDLLPLWVADMDFETPPFITDALRKRMEHPVFGYTVKPKDLWPAVTDWIESHHGWKVKSEWLTFIPGIVRGIGMAINVFVKKDEKVIIQPPVYHPFRLVPQANHRELVYNPLHENADGSYSMDFENLEKVADEKCRMLILSNPHNPGGIVWDRETLVRLAEFCYSRNILVISDEIHCDMTLWDNKHIPFASVSDEAAACSITFGAPSKTFNIAGIVSSYAIVPDDSIRHRFYSWMEANELNSPTLFSSIATVAAFREGEEWRRQMLHYVEGNIEYVIGFCKEFLPEIRPVRPQASFLVWLDCRNLGLNHEQLVDLFVNKAHLAFNDGAMFGQGGDGFMRMNVGTPLTIVKQAMSQMKTAVDSL